MKKSGRKSANNIVSVAFWSLALWGALPALCLTAISSCSNGSEQFADATSSGNVTQIDPGDTAGGAPRLDSIPIPITETLTGFDSFLGQPPEVVAAAVFLVRKYDPGLCYGMPGATPDSKVAAVVIGSPRLAAFIRETFGSQSDFQVFTKIRQLLAPKIRLEEDGKYEYFLQDGKCCDIIRLHGRLNLREGVFFDSLLRRSVENVPC